MKTQFSNFYTIPMIGNEAIDCYSLFPDLIRDYTYYKFYSKEGEYLGATALRIFTENGIEFKEWHTNFLTPTRKVLAEWQESIGGIWMAVMDANNPNLKSIRHALEKGGFLDCSITTFEEVIYIKEYDND